MCHTILWEMIVNNENILKGAKTAFFRAMLAGWAGDAKAEPVPGESGFKRTLCQVGDFFVIDKYGKGRGSNAAVGMTTIWYFDEPVWSMSYEGHYRKDEIPFLKSLLVEAYENGVFCGGRGRPIAMSDDTLLLYSNDQRTGSTFSRFAGREQIIVCANGDQLGQHGYRGGSLLSRS